MTGVPMLLRRNNNGEDGCGFIGLLKLQFLNNNRLKTAAAVNLGSLWKTTDTAKLTRAKQYCV
jgi:hypothetical protein